MGSDIGHSILKRLSQWKINVRAPIWMFTLIFIVAFLLNNFVDEGYREVVNQTNPPYLYPTP